LRLVLCFLSIASCIDFSSFPSSVPARLDGRFEASGRNGDVYKGQFTLTNGVEPNLQYLTQNTGSGSYFYSNKKLLHASEDGIKCHDERSVPPLHQVFEAFKNAVELDSSEVKPEYAAECATQRIYKVPFVGEAYLVCLGPTIIIRGSEFVLKIRESDPVALSTSMLEAHAEQCPKAIRQAHDIPLTKERDQWWRANSELSEKQITQRDCVFIHGSGQQNDLPPTTSFLDYWGNISQYTPQCRSRKFIHLDTRNYGWEDILHQKKICALALSNQQSPSTEIRNTMIFTHSMGTLLTAGALSNRICNLSNSSVWYGIGAPVDGSNLILFLSDICANTTLQQSLGSLLGFCIGDKPAGAYISMLPTNPNLLIARSTIEAHVSGMMCGTSSYGLNSRYSVALTFLANYAGLESPNDGMVWYSACSKHLRGDFNPYPQAKFYETSINHADTTCRNGNGWWGSDRRPCDFYIRVD